MFVVVGRTLLTPNSPRCGCLGECNGLLQVTKRMAIATILMELCKSNKSI